MSTTTNVFYSGPGMDEIPFSGEIRETARRLNASAFIVGGAVRDLLMNADIKDVDVVPFGCDYVLFASELAKRIKAGAIPFKDNVRLVKCGLIADVSKPRGEDIESDLAKRDFTINSMAISADGKLLGFPDDVKNGIVRASYKEAFDDDPLRVLRGFRFVSALGFRMEETTFALAETKCAGLAEVAQERISQEFYKIFSGPFLKESLDLMTNSEKVARFFSFDAAGKEKTCRLKPYESELDEDFFPAAVLCLWGTRTAPPISLSIKQEKTRRVLGECEKAIKETDPRDERSVKSFLWRRYDRARTISVFLKAVYGHENAFAAAAERLLPSIDPEKARLVNGEKLKKLGFPPSPLFKTILDETSEMLALGELDEKNLEKFILKKYG